MQKKRQKKTEVESIAPSVSPTVTAGAKNTVQALKYPSAHAVTLYMPGFKAIN